MAEVYRGSVALVKQPEAIGAPGQPIDDGQLARRDLSKTVPAGPRGNWADRLCHPVWTAFRPRS